MPRRAPSVPDRVERPIQEGGERVNSSRRACGSRAAHQHDRADQDDQRHDADHRAADPAEKCQSLFHPGQRPDHAGVPPDLPPSFSGRGGAIAALPCGSLPSQAKRAKPLGAFAHVEPRLDIVGPAAGLGRGTAFLQSRVVVIAVHGFIHVVSVSIASVTQRQRPCAAMVPAASRGFDATRVVGTRSDAGRWLPVTNLMEAHMGLGRGALLWLLGIPLPIIILLALFWR